MLVSKLISLLIRTAIICFMSIIKTNKYNKTKNTRKALSLALALVLALALAVALALALTVALALAPEQDMPFLRSATIAVLLLIAI